MTREEMSAQLYDIVEIVARGEFGDPLLTKIEGLLDRFASPPPSKDAGEIADTWVKPFRDVNDKPCIRIGGGIGICSCSLITDNMVEAQVIIFREEISKLLQAFADGKVREESAAMLKKIEQIMDCHDYWRWLDDNYGVENRSQYSPVGKAMESIRSAFADTSPSAKTGT